MARRRAFEELPAIEIGACRIEAEVEMGIARRQPQRRTRRVRHERLDAASAARRSGSRFVQRNDGAAGLPDRETARRTRETPVPRSDCGTPPDRSRAPAVPATDIRPRRPAAARSRSPRLPSRRDDRIARRVGHVDGDVAFEARRDPDGAGHGAPDRVARARTSQAARPLGCTSKPLKSLCSTLVPSVTRSESRRRIWSWTNPLTSWSREDAGSTANMPPLSFWFAVSR